MLKELKEKKCLFEGDELYIKYFSRRKETEFEKNKYEELSNVINGFYQKVYGDDNYKDFLIYYLSIGYLEDYGYYAITDADRGYKNIINLGEKVDDAFINLVCDALGSYAVDFECTNRDKLKKDFANRFGDMEYFHCLYYAEYELNQWSKYYNGNIPNNIIEKYEKYLNSILLGDIGKTNWQYNIEQALFIYKNNKVRKLKAYN